jgi:hypothetical protein
MKITEDVRRYAAEHGLSEQEALQKGMEEKSRQFVEKGAKLYPRHEARDSSDVGRLEETFVPSESQKGEDTGRASESIP